MAVGKSVRDARTVIYTGLTRIMDKDNSIVYKTGKFDLPRKRSKNGTYKPKGLLQNESFVTAASQC